MITELDSDARQRVLERDDYTCQRCGARNGQIDKDGDIAIVQWSHVISRRHYCLRWEEDNSKALCMKCHCWWTNNTVQAVYWFEQKFPERWERINKIFRLNLKFGVTQIKALLADLRGATK
jgi:5-methylcytosine-specific restriction endonuclease McrA